MTPEPGLFGKLPETGDFIARGLARANKRGLDRWATQYLAHRKDGWPKGGLRGLLDIEGGLVLMVAVSSADKVGRQFPLVAITSGDNMSLEDAEVWCDQAAALLERAADGRAGIDEVMSALLSLEPSDRKGPEGAQALWVAGGAPQPCDADTIDSLFSSG